ESAASPSRGIETPFAAAEVTFMRGPIVVVAVVTLFCCTTKSGDAQESAPARRLAPPNPATLAVPAPARPAPHPPPDPTAPAAPPSPEPSVAVPAPASPPPTAPRGQTAAPAPPSPAPTAAPPGTTSAFVTDTQFFPWVSMPGGFDANWKTGLGRFLLGVVGS